MKRRLYIQLGRVGDILNVLPLCKNDFDATGVRPILMIAHAFASVLDGILYVEPLIFGGDFEEVHEACKQAEPIAEANGLAIVVSQIYGRDLYGLETCSSFLRESWSRVPAAPPWGSLPLVFDHRDATREAGVKNQLLKRSTGKPYIVLALNGTSSPFPYYAQLVAYLRNKLGRAFDFVDVSGFIAPRFYDLLGTLEGAQALIAIDSAVLHLAAAVPELPVFAFITREPSPWHGSAWRAQHRARYFYDEAPECFAALVDDVIMMHGDHPMIAHVWSHFQSGIDEQTARRNAFARSTWRHEYESARWLECEFTERDAKRSSAELGDPRPVPYMRDVIDHALKFTTRPDDVIAWTNADVCFTPGLTGWILDRMRREECAYTHRWDFHRELDRPMASEALVRRGEWYMGSDAFFFTVGWWRRHRSEYPDMILGREQNDEILRQLIKRHGGREIADSIYHEKHPSFWEHFGNREKNPGNRHNRILARKWFLKTGFGPNDPIWWAVPGGSAKPYQPAPLIADPVG